MLSAVPMFAFISVSAVGKLFFYQAVDGLCGQRLKLQGEGKAKKLTHSRVTSYGQVRPC